MGHATAAFRQGCRRVEVGIGWYIYFFVFFADLSESWKLKRQHRALIDAGGMYFQALYIALLIGLFYHFQNPATYFAILLLNFSLIWNLNPFLRLDGYWLASDLLGIANLRQEASRVLQTLPSLLTAKAKAHQLHPNLSAKTLALLIVYTIISNLFFVWIFYLISTDILFETLKNIPSSLDKIRSLPEKEFILSDWTVAITQLAWQTLFLYFLLYFVFKMIKRISTGLKYLNKKRLRNSAS